MPEPDDLALLVTAARAAGEIAVQFFNRPHRRWDKPEGAGPVTEADLAVNRMLEDSLRAARPDYGWLSEETEDDRARLSRDTVFIVDPIDGTRSFIDGAKTWAHSLAIARGGVVVAGAVYLPLRDRLFTAAAGRGAFLNGQRLSAAPVRPVAECDVLAARPVMSAVNWPGGVPGFQRSYRPSLAYRMALVAQGRFDGMVTLRPAWEWDIAAGDILQREAGAVTSDRAGSPLRFNTANAQLDGVVAASPDLHARMLSALGTA